MTRPGTEVILRESAPPRSAPTDTSVFFAAGVTERGGATPTLVSSLAQYEREFGERSGAATLMYDSMETFWREGGGEAYIMRVIGDAAGAATLDLGELVVDASSPGTWGNTLKVGTDARTTPTEGYRLRITDAADNVLELSPWFTTQAEAVAWSPNSDLVTVKLGTGSDPPDSTVAPAALAGGTAGAALVDADWDEALALFDRALGPGQVAMPGRTTEEAHEALLVHAESHNRCALLDGPDVASAPELIAAAEGLRGDPSRHERFGGIFAPVAIVPGVVPGTLREVPYSAVQAALIARSDSSGMSPNVAAAGANGQCRYVVDVKRQWSDVDRESLNDAGVNIARVVYGGVRSYGYRSLADPYEDFNWVSLANVRLYMAIVAEGESVAETYVFSQIDGKRITISRYGGDLTGMLIPYYEAGSLYGDRAEESFAVDVGEQINTVETIANGELRAVISLRMSPFAELVVLEIVKTSVQEVLA